jgi:methyltransferase (TIGR00027 family)
VIADGQPSLTALTAAAARATHLIVDGEPVIFADTLAEAMLGERAGELVAYHLTHGTHPVLAGARTQVTCRSRYAEDSLARGIERGIGQYVVLGAGLDTFAYRSPLAGRVRVFEVDHPATQSYKRRIGAVASAVRGAPDEVRFVPVDFSRDGFGSARDVGQRDMIPAAAWNRSDALHPAELSRIAHAAIP